jgi:hypothetical protein
MHGARLGLGLAEVGDRQPIRIDTGVAQRIVGLFGRVG